MDREKTPSLYKITDTQMRFVMWLQILAAFLIVGLFFLPFTIFYYLGWAHYNIDKDTSFLDFLNARKPSGVSSKEEVLNVAEGVVGLMKKLLAFAISTTIFIVGWGAAHVFFGDTRENLSLEHANKLGAFYLVSLFTAAYLAQLTYRKMTKTKPKKRTVTKIVKEYVIAFVVVGLLTAAALGYVFYDSIEVWTLSEDSSSRVSGPEYSSLESCATEGRAQVKSGLMESYVCRLDCNEGYRPSCMDFCTDSGCISRLYK